MAGALIAAHGVPVRLTTAGTHVVEHQPISRRTRDALTGIGMEATEHRSRQLTEADIASADLVIAMAAEHVLFVRRRHPSAAARTATLSYLADHLPAGPGSLAERVAGLGLADVDPQAQGDIDDPAGGDDAEYSRCAAELAVLTSQLVVRLG
jgi:protein-tyrosine phosphatase